MMLWEKSRQGLRYISVYLLYYDHICVHPFLLVLYIYFLAHTFA
jgi:hypothetical protein